MFIVFTVQDWCKFKDIKVDFVNIVLLLENDLPGKGYDWDRAQNFLSSSHTIKHLVQSKTFVQQTSSVTHNLSVRVSFSYRIGKLSVEKAERKRRSINNDDLKGSKD